MADTDWGWKKRSDDFSDEDDGETDESEIVRIYFKSEPRTLWQIITIKLKYLTKYLGETKQQ
jgi:hypothetical protein